MQTLMILYIVAFGFSQAAGAENYTQMYYVKLRIDNSILGHLTEKLKSFQINDMSNINNVAITRSCEKDQSCSCEDGFMQNEVICPRDLTCCGKASCSFETIPSRICISNTTVRLLGSLTLVNIADYKDCLKDKSTEDYHNCERKLLNKMKDSYGTLTGFDTLIIKQFRYGSIIADFQMTVASVLDPEILSQKSINLTQALQAQLSVETSGVIQIHMPSGHVNYGSTQIISCTSTQDLKTNPIWQVTNLDGLFNITNGTGANIAAGALSTKVSLTKVDELWKGQYKCSFIKANGNITITHKANASLDVCLLPDIRTSTQPAFPRCKTATDNLVVTVKCSISTRTSNENYTVTWPREALSTSKSQDGLEYTAKYFIDCSAQGNNTNPLNCAFINSCNQQKNGIPSLNIIKSGDAFCSAEGEWEDTKAGFTAEIKCQNEDGLKTRRCNQDGTWDQVVDQCVNSDLKVVLDKAIISDIGLGVLDVNAATVFSRFKNVTETKSINTFSNINTSVKVLSTMQTKVQKIQSDAVENFLDSSSHLLNDTLRNSWNDSSSGPSSDNNSSLAERYLISVEELIKKSALTENKTRANLEVVKCQQDSCTNSVFNVSITLQSSGHGAVKSTGFKNLEQYLPHNDTESAPNSIVVSTTVENRTEQAKVQIKFDLMKKRPRNVEMMCVAWDNTTHEWSDQGCKWKGPSDEGVCTCEHLSSFTILMSKYPLKIEGLSIVTYVGLSVSVISLLISLVIEFIVWSDVTKTSTLYLRHTAHVNISLCLLIANCCFLASSEPDALNETWCRISAVIKHFFYLAMFFWMLCLSTTLLHQAVFLFHKVSKTVYLRYSLVLGYLCPLIIVFITFITNASGAKDVYFSTESCWLIYEGVLKGSIFTFILPMGTIVFVNAFAMMVVIMKLLDHHQNAEASQEKEKMAAKAVVRSVILLTPIFGLTWIFGFGISFLDLASGTYVEVIHYVFNVLNGFQGLFILLTTCLGDRMTREALLKRFNKNAPESISESTTKLDSSSAGK